MFIVVSYDIKDDKVRKKVLDELKNYGEHVQLSVFECDISKKQIRELRKKLKSLVNKKKDNIRYYYLCRKCTGKIHIQGRNKISI